MTEITERLFARKTGMRLRHPPARDLLLIDGSCAFCRRWADRAHRHLGVAVAPYQDRARDFPEIPYREFERKVQLLDAQGRRFSGAGAAARLLGRRWGLGWIYFVYRLPPFRQIADGLYALVSRYRDRL